MPFLRRIRVSGVRQQRPRATPTLQPMTRGQEQELEREREREREYHAPGVSPPTQSNEMSRNDKSRDYQLYYRGVLGIGSSSSMYVMLGHQVLATKGIIYYKKSLILGPFPVTPVIVPSALMRKA